MPRLLRKLGALLATVWTLTYGMIAAGFLTSAIPFIYGFLIPLFAGTLVLIALSYLFAFIMGVAGGSPSPFTQFCAVIYLIACTVVLVLAIVPAVMFTMRAPQLLIIGVVALLFFLVPHALQVLVGYILAATFAPVSAGTERLAECFFRGTLIGMNTAMNAIFGIIFYSMMSSPPVYILVGVIVVILMLVSLGTSLASATLSPALPFADTVQRLIEAQAGWLSCLLPMSWVYCVYGWASFYVSWIGHFLSLLAPSRFPSSRCEIVAIHLGLAEVGANGLDARDSAFGVITMNGGIASPATTVVAHSCGCFTFNSGGAISILQHEGGHHLNLAAFGFVFGFIGALNANGWGPFNARWKFEYGERVAESNLSQSRGNPEVQVWR
jgi:hypothetical protein